ncbi:helix-turn-helix domain-containing protein [Bifidobacterium sp. SMB2]|uniref:Helix-turn-helix domain-containing protein n=1 Tax=Bifidobacterium saimiriisciurei TaxID=2661627 RepID=A0ABX0CAK1_9BIFI|nr:helix-turn-helix domain-containing protein [Bifidobacterium sp. SMB2]NEH12161.1 helix-turn-helix domain-containing protein [Bifidobacterium saimiriisciurei]
MKPAERNVVNEQSEHFRYRPTNSGAKVFLYPEWLGTYRYVAGYKLNRGPLDNFLLFFIRSGRFGIDIPGRERIVAHAGDFVLIDCYEPQSYEALADSEVLWIHFNGVSARMYYDFISERAGNVFSTANSQFAVNRLRRIGEGFRGGTRMSEPLMSRYLTDILTECASGVDDSPEEEQTHQYAMEDVQDFIVANLAQPLTNDELANMACMSRGYFIKEFRRATGLTPHAFLVKARMDAAKRLLARTDDSLKRICAKCGFSSPSAFCLAFRNAEGMTPLEYRRSVRG